MDASRSPQSQSFNVRDFGAVGDGLKLETAALQKALDAAHRQGGGQVYFPPGRYKSGTLVLKDHVHLFLEAGATLLGSTKREDYQSHNPFTGPGAAHRDYCPEHLLYAYQATNIGIGGRGTIDGSGEAFHTPARPGWTHLTPTAWRPVRLIALVSCRNVTVTGVTIQNAPGWTLWPYDCENVRIQGIRIVNHRWGPNTDALDIDCSRNVTVSDCYLDAGDDSIAIKSSSGLLAGEHPCENITVTNCVLSSTTCGIRVGFEGDHPIRNCLFSNLIMTRTRTGICIQAPTAPEASINHGVPLENIRFSNIAMDTRLAFFLFIGDESKAPCCIRDIYFSDIHATTERGCFIGGSRTLPLENIHFNNIDLTVYGEMSAEFLERVPYPYRVWDFWNKRGIPHALFCRHVRGLHVNGLQVRWQTGGPQRQVIRCESNEHAAAPVTVGGVEGPWGSALRCEEVTDLEVRDLVCRQAPGPARAAAVHLQDVRAAYLQGCRAAPGCGTFIKVDGSQTKDIRLGHNELSAAEHAVEISPAVLPQACSGQDGNRKI